MQTVVESIGQKTQDCPACDGIMPDTAITFTPWRTSIVNGVAMDHRHVRMHCPHCNHRESKTERRPVGGSFFPLTADR